MDFFYSWFFFVTIEGYILNVYYSLYFIYCIFIMMLFFNYKLDIVLVLIISNI